MDKEFSEWFEKHRAEFYSGDFDVEQIAFSAWHAAQQNVQATMLDDGQIFKMPEPKVIARGLVVWDDPHSA